MKFHGAAVAVFALGATGACVKVPAFEGRDGSVGDGNQDDDAATDAMPPGAAIEVAQNGDAISVTGPGYVLNFSTDGSRFPYQLIVGGQHFLGGSQSCNDELDMGVAIYPVQRFVGTPSPGVSAPSVTVPLTGPWVGQVRIAWSASFECGVGDGSLTGSSVFSFFPDGRLTRFDRVVNAAARMGSDCIACSGGAGSTFYVTSFNTLVVDPGAYLSDGNEATLDTYGEQVTNPGLTACVNQRGQSVAFAWTAAPTRLRVVTTSPRAIAFVKDMYSDATLPQMDWATTTQIGISPTEACGALEARIGPFADSDHSIRINGVAVGAALTDGIFGGHPRTTGYPVDFPVTITPGQTILPRMPAGFAVWLYSASIPANLTLTHSGGHTGAWYRLQRVGQDQLVIWFDVPLEDGEMITISGS